MEEKIEPLETTFASRGISPRTGLLLSEDQEKFRVLVGKKEVWAYKHSLLYIEFPSALTKETLKAIQQKQAEKAKRHAEVENAP